MVTFKLIPKSQNYYAGSDGHIYSNFGKGYKKLSPGLQSTGKYYFVSVVINNIRKTHRVHRLICLAFHGKPKSNKMTTSHLNGNWKDNRPENLAWESYSKNLSRKKDHGTDDIGVNNSRAKISIEQLRQIRLLLSQGLTHQKIADKFGVNRVFITKIATGYRYKNQGLD
jgi:hypothetical protein